jgi:hypothetical protein
MRSRFGSTCEGTFLTIMSGDKLPAHIKSQTQAERLPFVRTATVEVEEAIALYMAKI